MNLRLTKKAAIEMSLNLIIMLIIGLTVLGLVIGFVTQLVGQAQGNLGENLDQIEQRDRENCLAKEGTFHVCPASFDVSVGDTRTFFAKVYNPTGSPLSVTSVNGEIVTGTTGSSKGGGAPFSVSGQPVSVASGCDITVTSPGMSVNPGTSVAVPFSVAASEGCSPGDNFFVSVAFTPSADFRDTKTVEGEVKE